MCFRLSEVDGMNGLCRVVRDVKDTHEIRTSSSVARRAERLHAKTATTQASAPAPKDFEDSFKDATWLAGAPRRAERVRFDIEKDIGQNLTRDSRKSKDNLKHTPTTNIGGSIEIEIDRAGVCHPHAPAQSVSLST
jgi:hypothetical protein